MASARLRRRPRSAIWACWVVDLAFGDVERGGDLRELLAQRGDRCGQLLDLGLGGAARLLFGGERLFGILGAAAHGAELGVSLAQLARRLIGLRRLGGKLGDLALQRVAFGERRLQLARQAGGAGAQIGGAAALEGEQIAQLADLLLQLLQRLVAAGQRVRQKELAGAEHQENEDDHHQQLRQGVDEARPDVDAGPPRAAVC